MFNDLEELLDEFENSSVANNASQSSRDYRCPTCDGEFNEWDTGNADIRRGTPSCPFCGTEKGNYANDISQESSQQNEEFSSEELGRQIISNVFGISPDAFDDDQTNLQDLLEGEVTAPEQER